MASVTDEMAMLSVSDADVDKKVALIKENIQEKENKRVYVCTIKYGL